MIEAVFGICNIPFGIWVLGICSAHVYPQLPPIPMKSRVFTPLFVSLTLSTRRWPNLLQRNGIAREHTASRLVAEESRPGQQKGKTNKNPGIGFCTQPTKMKLIIPLWKELNSEAACSIIDTRDEMSDLWVARVTPHSGGLRGAKKMSGNR